MKKYLIPFQNVKFNIWLFAALALSSVAGTILPQVPEAPEKVQEFLMRWPTLGPVLDRMGFLNVYYSWWFIGMLGLMAFDVIVCKLIFAKYPGTKTFKADERGPGAIGRQKLQDSFVVASPVNQLRDAALALLARERYAARPVVQADGSLLILASKQRAQRFGSWVSHISIVLILLANLTGALYGFREVLNVPEGTSAQMKNRSWAVSCNKFLVERYEGTQTPRTFASDIQVFADGLLKADRRIVVNEPLEVDQVRFYQSSYGPYLKEAKIGVFRKDHPKQSPVIHLKLDEEAAVPGTPYSVRILQFAPDFAFNEKQEPSSQSSEPRNPAIQILISRGGKPVRAPWIFEKLPGMQMPPLAQDDELIPILTDYVPSYYTGLQIAYDPGAGMFWAASSLLVISLMLLFYLHHRKVWIHLAPAADELAGDGPVTTVNVGGFSSRGASFEPEFLRFMRRLKAEA